jgi:SAM-dependent methyltransferase
MIPFRRMNGPAYVDAAERTRRFYDDLYSSPGASSVSGRAIQHHLVRALRARVPTGLHVLEIGCGTGDLLASLEPGRGVGIDLAQSAVDAARARHKDKRLTFVQGDGSDRAVLERVGGPFDVILLVNVVTELADIQGTFDALRHVCHERTRLLVYSYSRLWQPVFRLAELLRIKRRPAPGQSWVPPEEVRNLLGACGYEVVLGDSQILSPVALPFVSEILNRYVAHLPVLRRLVLLYGLSARPAPLAHRDPSVSVVVPCRNEQGHIRPLVDRLPSLPEGSEVIFVEGHSSDDTAGEIERVIADNPALPLRFFRQPGHGKGDAVRAAFARAQGEVLLILDSDMGVAPEDIPKFVELIASGRAQFANGSRMVYPMQGKAMRFLNMLANRFFAALFSWLLGQQVRDTLCGTKALWRDDYERIAAARSYFGEFDPFGDFDLLFGAARLGLHIRDVPVRYHARQYGSTNISRFRHGWLLLRMSSFAARKLLFV